MIERTYASEAELMASLDQQRREAEEHDAVLEQMQGLEIGDMTSTTARRLRIVAGELHIDPPHESVPDGAIWAVSRTADGYEVWEHRR